MAKGKKYLEAARRFDREHLYSASEALALVKSLSSRNFDESLDAAIRLGIFLALRHDGSLVDWVRTVR